MKELKEIINKQGVIFYSVNLFVEENIWNTKMMDVFRKIYTHIYFPQPRPAESTAGSSMSTTTISGYRSFL
jgi:hypothetical protein